MYDLIFMKIKVWHYLEMITMLNSGNGIMGGFSFLFKKTSVYSQCFSVSMDFFLEWEKS